MRILVARNWLTHNNKPVENYSTSIVRVLREKGHEVIDSPKVPRVNYNGIDLILDLDCGRNEKGELVWMAQDGPIKGVKTSVWFIDTHGYPELHHRLARNYNYVHFAVWDKRDRFTGHPSAHWTPNATDKHWFDGEIYPKAPPGPFGYDFGFFGSKDGLGRALPMVQIANDRGWTHDVREVGRQYKNRWPSTQEAMANCRNLFNSGQKHDGPNLRVMESMLMKRPLISDEDATRSGMSKLFTAGKHYIPYEDYINHKGLAEAMEWVIENRESAMEIAEEAYIEVKTNHLVENRINQILEVCDGN